MSSETPQRHVDPLAELLNRDCHCITVDEGELQRRLETDLGDDLLSARLLADRPHLLALSPVFVSHQQVETMREIVRAVETVVGTGGYRETVLPEAPPIAHPCPGPSGVFFGYDFHLTAEGPKLIEINTNAGGALLNFYLAKAQRACCAEVENLVIGQLDPNGLEEALVQMFRREWHHQRGEAEPKSIVIVDRDPPCQFLYPEFLLFQRLFARHGLAAAVADPSEIACRGESLWLGDLEIDLLYNRLTDFYLEAPENAVLAEAYRSGRVILTPSPHAHALYANKRNLTLFSDPERLRAWGVEEPLVETLMAGIPRASIVTPERASDLWAERRRLFFKPLAGYGSRGTYRGDKLTRRAWGSILDSAYIAQERIPPSQRLVVVDGDSRALKLDVRCYVYDGEIQLLGARLYQGQATNLRTAGGGLATVFTPRSA